VIELSPRWEIFQEDDSAFVAVLTSKRVRAFSTGMDLREGITLPYINRLCVRLRVTVSALVGGWQWNAI
jgi:enoyl-CoA hydratase/carnithine racemase